MNVLRPVAVAIILAFVAPAGADDKSAAPTGDLAKFQGKWKTKMGRDKQIDVAITIKDKSVTANGTGQDGQSFEIKGEIKLDENAKPHKTVDWVKFTRPNGDDMPDNLGIYTFEGEDSIKICNGGPGKDRPTEFKADDEGHGLIVLKRDKD
jgi:uncharacterized protein (TIGR03067 family)